jgi:hypothetical protein
LMRNSARPGWRSERTVLGAITGSSCIGPALGVRVMAVAEKPVEDHADRKEVW